MTWIHAKVTFYSSFYNNLDYAPFFFLMKIKIFNDLRMSMHPSSCQCYSYKFLALERSALKDPVIPTAGM